MFKHLNALPYSFRTLRIFLFAFFSLTSGTLLADGITVGTGDSINLNGGTLSLDCGDLVVDGQMLINAGTATGIGNVNIAGGQLTAGSGTVSLSGDWSNSGNFSSGTSVVRMVDGCGISESRLAGDNDFNVFSVTSTNGKLLEVKADSSQYFAAGLTLKGQEGTPLRIRSSVPGQEVFFSLEVDGQQSIFAVDVSDNNAEGGQPLAPGYPADYKSVDSGSNENWFNEILDLIFRDSFES